MFFHVFYDQKFMLTSIQFARYLAQEIQSSNHIGESSDSSDEEEGGWLSQSNFNLGSPPISARRQGAGMTERRPLGASGFDVRFVYLCYGISELKRG